MEQSKVKYPKSGGAKRSAERFEKNRKKEPSDRLVNIISEYGTPEPESKPKKDERAAKETGI